MDQDTDPYTGNHVYPYLAGQTGLESLIIPSWAQAGGRNAMLERFRQPDLRAQIAEEADEAMRLPEENVDLPGGGEADSGEEDSVLRGWGVG